jgi:hypothetical protein
MSDMRASNPPRQFPRLSQYNVHGLHRNTTRPCFYPLDCSLIFFAKTRLRAILQISRSYNSGIRAKSASCWRMMLRLGWCHILINASRRFCCQEETTFDREGDRRSQPFSVRTQPHSSLGFNSPDQMDMGQCPRGLRRAKISARL